MFTIAVDVINGFHAPKELVRGAAQASLSLDSQLLLLGDAAIIGSVLEEERHNAERISIHHIKEDEDEDIPSLAMTFLADGTADAMVTAGRIQPMLSQHEEILPLLNGVPHPALATVYPTRIRRGRKDDPFSLILDHGAVLGASARDLVAFAVMGSAYARCISRNPVPKVALLSVSRDPTAGPAEVQQAYEILSRMPEIEFIGTIEGTDIPRGLADVVVCNGFTGHIVVRMLDGIAESAMEIAEAAYEERFTWRVGLRMLSGGLKQLRRVTDWSEYGGAPLLGFQKPILVAHEASKRRAVVNTIKVALKSVREKIPKRIEEQLAILESTKS